MEATAKYDYETTALDELSFKKGEPLKILRATGNWYKAECNGAEGLVPKNFINIHLPSWYQEDCSRSEAQEKLMAESVGAFLIRGSRNTAHGGFSISVRHASNVQHFKVLKDSRGQYYLWAEKFPSLNQLVEHYRYNSISRHTQIFLQQQKRERSERRSLPPPPQPTKSQPVPPPRRKEEQFSRKPLPSVPPFTEGPPVPAPRQRLGSSRPQVRALYSFQAEEEDELGFDVGDVIEVLAGAEGSWWRGQLRGRTGLFPSNYTKPL